jgi:hypothetical protein
LTARAREPPEFAGQSRRREGAAARQQAPGFWAQKSSNFCAFEPAGGRVSFVALSWPPGAAAPPPVVAVPVPVPPVPPVVPVLPVVVPVPPLLPVEPVAPLGLAVGVGVGVAELVPVEDPLPDELLESALLPAVVSASDDTGIGASAYGLGAS